MEIYLKCMTSSIQEYVITKSKRKLEWHIPTQQWTIVHDNIRDVQNDIKRSIKFAKENY